MAATATATVTIEFPIPNNWTDDKSLKEVYESAEDAARKKLYDMVRNHGARITSVKVDAVIYPSSEAIKV